MLFLCAIGLTMIFGIMGVINFAHGSFYMLGAYFAYSSVSIAGSYWIALVVAPVLVGCVGAAVEITTLRFIYLRPHFYMLLLTFGVLLLFDSLIQNIWGAGFKYVATHEVLSGSVVILSQTYPLYRLFVLSLAVVVAVGILFALQKTTIGISIRAVSQDSEMATALGINVKAVRTLVFAFGCALAGLAGVAVAPMVSASLGMGVSFLIQSFAVVIIGGLGSVLGSIVGSAIVGASQTWGTFLFPEGAMVIMYLLMVLILVFKTRGLFGEEE
jgi:branched-chain amino acid transport system permease protein